MRLKSDPKVEFLRGLPLFADCSPADLGEIATVADQIALPAGKRLTTEGASGEELVLIVSGTAAVLRRGQTVATLGPGDVVGEIALLTGRPRSATVVATSPVTILVIARPLFRSLVDRLPGVRSRLNAVIALREVS